MKVYIEKQDKKLRVKARNVKELLDKLEINPTTVIVVKNDELVLDEEKLNEKDNIKILEVISGG